MSDSSVDVSLYVPALTEGHISEIIVNTLIAQADTIAIFSTTKSFVVCCQSSWKYTSLTPVSKKKNVIKIISLKTQWQGARLQLVPSPITTKVLCQLARDFIQLANYMYRGYFGKRPVMTVKGVKETRICYTSKFIVELNMLSSLIGRRHYRGEIDQKPVIDGWTSTQETLT